MSEKELATAYDEGAEKFLFSRTEGKDLSGLQNREVEQPEMFELVPKDLSDLKLIDIGCGPGIHAREYTKRGAEVSGIDISPKMIELAKQYCPEGNFNVGNIYKIEFDDNNFDILTASFVLDHIKELKKAAKEIKRVLKKEGLFIFSVPHPIINMFRGSKHSDFTPSHTYYNKSEIYCNIANSGKNFVDFPRILEEYFKTFLEEGFELINFIENKPDKKWKERYEDFDENLLKVPFLCFFKWRKK